MIILDGIRAVEAQKLLSGSILILNVSEEENHDQTLV